MSLVGDRCMRRPSCEVYCISKYWGRLGMHSTDVQYILSFVAGGLDVMEVYT